MLKLLFKLILYRIYILLGFPRILPINYTLSVTDKCNSKCKTCFIYEKSTGELSLTEYEYIFKDIGNSPYWVTISGGEPFLRKDLTQLTVLLDKYCRPHIINIPTNGILTSKIVQTVSDICTSLPRTQIIINLSIDAINSHHDEIRGVHGNYHKVLETYNRLSKLTFDNLTVGIHTVISSFNVDEFPAIAERLLALSPDTYITEIAEERGEMLNFDKGITPEALKYRAAVDYLLHQTKNKKYKGIQRITQAFRIEYYHFVKKMLRTPKRLIPCYAGVASCHISAEGDVWFCCIKAQSVGRIQKDKYSFKEIWYSQTAKKYRKELRKSKCFCPLANTSYTNMLLHIPSLLKIFYRSFIKWY